MVDLLIDTNVISELTRPEPDPGVIKFFQGIHDQECYLSVVTLGEIYQGIQLLRKEGKRDSGKLIRASHFENWLAAIVRQFKHNILVVDLDVSLAWGKRIPKEGHASDKLIGATAEIYGLTVVTKNVSDFPGLPLLNPFEA